MRRQVEPRAAPWQETQKIGVERWRAPADRPFIPKVPAHSRLDQTALHRWGGFRASPIDIPDPGQEAWVAAGPYRGRRYGGGRGAAGDAVRGRREPGRTPGRPRHPVREPPDPC